MVFQLYQQNTAIRKLHNKLNWKLSSECVEIIFIYSCKITLHFNVTLKRILNNYV
jgi:hypothetical protein